MVKPAVAEISRAMQNRVQGAVGTGSSVTQRPGGSLPWHGTLCGAVGR